VYSIIITHIPCVPVQIRAYSSTAHDTIAEEKIALVIGPIAFTKQEAYIEASTLVPIAGDPADPRYEETVPDLPSKRKLIQANFRPLRPFYFPQCLGHGTPLLSLQLPHWWPPFKHLSLRHSKSLLLSLPLHQSGNRSWCWPWAKEPRQPGQQSGITDTLFRHVISNSLIRNSTK